tara:strand:+ start:9 stop:1457 length:1449 start_codon:yes stop_codon:yes gene_type:complete
MAITSNYTPTPAPIKQTLASAYLDFTGGSSTDWARQYVPDLMEQEAEVFGNRTISGFLSQVGAEESMTADQVVWSEQSRLHLSYQGTTGGTGTTITITQDADGATPGTTVYSTADHGVRAGDMLIVANASVTLKCFVLSVNGTTGVITVDVYDRANMTSSSGIADSQTVKVLVYGSEYAKGAVGRDSTNKAMFKSYDNKPIIIKDKYDISGSDASQIGWVEVSGEAGQSGYLWYLKSSGDTRSRFTDYIEMAMVESQKASVTITATQTSATGTIAGTEGLFAAIETRGNETTGVTGVNAATDLAEFDAILAELDKNGAIEENMMFLNRTTALAVDDMLASMNSYGSGGTSYGVFDNSEDMALNLGFSGFRRGSYDFYKSDWKYLNDLATRGLINAQDTVNAIRGVMIPAGVSSVYDQGLGRNMKRPFLHVRYRASQTDDRRFKNWVTGSVGAVTSDLDAMEVHYLSERCLVVQGANNFFLMN